MGKAGRLLLNEGKFGENYLFERETFRQCLKRSEAYAGYGLTFWLLDSKPDRLEGRPWLKGGYMVAVALAESAVRR